MNARTISLILCTVLLAACSQSVTPPTTEPVALSLPANSFALVPRDTSVAVGETVTVDLVATDVQAVFGVEIDVTYTDTVVSFASVSEGTFLNENGAVETLKLDVLNTKTPGLIRDFVAVKLAGDGTSGSGTLATYTFTANAPGTATLALADVLVANKNSEKLSVTTVGATVTVS